VIVGCGSDVGVSPTARTIARRVRDEGRRRLPAAV